MPVPTCKKQVQSFIGIINYLSTFSARLSEIAEPIRELAKDKVPFNLGPEHQSAFTQMKKQIASISILAYYNPKKQTVLKTDANTKGLGACLLQEEKPVYFASKTLTDIHRVMLQLSLNHLQLPGLWKNFTISCIQAISSWKPIRSLSSNLLKI